MNLRMAVGESEAAAILVHRAAVIHRVRAGSNHGHGGIVDCPGIIINKSPNVRRGAYLEIGGLAERGIRRVRYMTMGTVKPGTVGLSPRRNPQPWVNAHALVERDAADDFYPGYAHTFTEIGKERGWPPTTRAKFDAVRGPTGALLIQPPA